MTLHDELEPVTVNLSILDENDSTFKIQTEWILRTNNTDLVNLRINDLNIGHSYKFVAEGVQGLLFKNETKLRAESKNVSLFIQMDKAIYMPNETIKFRVLVLDSLLRPVTLKNDALLDIFITDSENNRIKQWKGVDTYRGVFTDELQLSDLPVLGDWKIEAKVGLEVNCIFFKLKVIAS